ncbi:hypothetical protein BaRGS_00035567, partial [Batillaria attramentaria]
ERDRRARVAQGRGLPSTKRSDSWRDSERLVHLVAVLVPIPHVCYSIKPLFAQ